MKRCTKKEFRRRQQERDAAWKAFVKVRGTPPGKEAWDAWRVASDRVAECTGFKERLRAFTAGVREAFERR